MAFTASVAAKLALLLAIARATLAQNDNPCKSFGMDFQDGGNYFQNSLSSDPFTCVSQFQGCQPDVANNILVDPKGDQVQCSDTPLTPSDTNQMSTCPIKKNQLYTGEWSFIIISNNGNAAPIAYQRDFSLSVGPQATTTFTPTVTVLYTHTPVVNKTSTTTDIITTKLPAQTVTSPSITLTPTRTTTPQRVTTTSFKTLFTMHPVKPTVAVHKTTKTITAACRTPFKPQFPDPWCKIVPTVVKAAALAPSATATKKSSKFRRVDPAVLDEKNRMQFLKERSERLASLHALEKRAPDQPTLTITDSDTAHYPTITSTATAEPSTISVVITEMQTSTITPSPVTVVSGKTVAPVVTITAPTPTRTVNRVTYAVEWKTKTYDYTVTITTKVTPSASATECRRAGGMFW